MSPARRPGGRRPWVFLSHTLDQVGPPVFLLAFLRWLRAETEIEPVVVSLAGGRLQGDFARLGPVHVVPDPDPAVVLGPVARGALAVREQQARWALRGLGDAALIYVNTAGSIRAARFLPPSTAPLVGHVHELEVGLSFHGREADHAALFRPQTRWVAASDAVAANLVEHHGLARPAITVHHEMIAVDVGPATDSPEALRDRLGIPVGAPIVGTAAIVDWRKAPDLFVQLAGLVTRLDPGLDAHFVWIGGQEGHPDMVRFRADVAAAGLGGRVHVVAAVPRPLDWMRAFDVFVLPAREDAFPLACLEAASVGLPIVCFDSGGMPEFVEDDAGLVIEYPDVDRFAAAVVTLLHDPVRARQLGATGAAKVRERHDVTVAAPALYDDLARWAGR